MMSILKRVLKNLILEMAKNKKVKMEDDCGGIKPIKMLPPKKGTTKKKVKTTKK